MCGVRSDCVCTNMPQGVVRLGEGDDMIVKSISVDDCLALHGAFLRVHGELPHLKSYSQGSRRQGGREMVKGGEGKKSREGGRERGVGREGQRSREGRREQGGR